MTVSAAFVSDVDRWWRRVCRVGRLLLPLLPLYSFMHRSILISSSHSWHDDIVVSRWISYRVSHWVSRWFSCWVSRWVSCWVCRWVGCWVSCWVSLWVSCTVSCSSISSCRRCANCFLTRCPAKSGTFPAILHKRRQNMRHNMNAIDRELGTSVRSSPCAG